MFQLNFQLICINTTHSDSDSIYFSVNTENSVFTVKQCKYSD